MTFLAPVAGRRPGTRRADAQVRVPGGDGRDGAVDRLVLGFDGTPRAWVALRAATTAALLRGCGLELLAVRGDSASVGRQRRPDEAARDGRARPAGRTVDRGLGVTTSIGGARRLVMAQHPSMAVTATVLLSERLGQPLSGASMLVLGWLGASTDLAAGLGSPGLRLLRAASVPVLVVPAGAANRTEGPVVLVLDSRTDDRTFETAIRECWYRDAPLQVVASWTDLSTGRARARPALVVAGTTAGHGHRPDESETARLVNGAGTPVLLVPTP